MSTNIENLAQQASERAESLHASTGYVDYDAAFKRAVAELGVSSGVEKKIVAHVRRQIKDYNDLMGFDEE